jgi:hypothetical protein
MRLIEEQMLNAIHDKAYWSKGNTRVDTNAILSKAYIYLHGHHIATYHHNDGVVDTDLTTLAAWPTVTTKSRLRALGVDVATRKGITYINGAAL